MRKKHIKKKSQQQQQRVEDEEIMSDDVASGPEVDILAAESRTHGAPAASPAPANDARPDASTSVDSERLFASATEAVIKMCFENRTFIETLRSLTATSASSSESPTAVTAPAVAAPVVAASAAPVVAASAAPVVASPAAPAGNIAMCTARFDGRSRDPEVLEAFLDAVEVYKQCGNVSDEHALRGLPVLLEGDAAVWWRGARHGAATWPDAVARLRNKYGVQQLPYKFRRPVRRGSLAAPTKRESFADDPLQNKSVTQLPGVGVSMGGKLAEKGIFEVSQLYEKLESLRFDKSKFQSWMASICGALERHSQDCYEALVIIRDKCDDDDVENATHGRGGYANATIRTSRRKRSFPGPTPKHYKVSKRQADFETLDVDDPITSFFLSSITTVKSFPRHLQLQVKHQIFGIIMSAEQKVGAESEPVASTSHDGDRR